ncbi:MAG: cyclophilin-like fold protein [Lachnospiraceae bacterium]|nr:cyclophilin-like fold protein [Lachnospiraceae bacterium]MDY4165709.1 cyclophilin-like fold protein [Lachnospiraceae bacterium]
MAKNNSTQINIEIGKKTFKATLYNNKTSSALLKKFPLSCKMSELNGNEKYKYLSSELPTNKKKVKRIKAGDIMLYGSDCLVVFYKSYKTSYKYTKVGHIYNTSGLKKAVGKGKVKMKFTRIREQSNSNKTNPTTAPNQQANKRLMLKIGDKKVDVSWEENESVGALMDMCKDSPLEIQMSMYGGFEQVGSLGTNLPRNDSQTTTSSGDIVLYSGNQIVVFYGSNSWSYTRLGHITDQDNEGMAELLSQGDVTITISVE